LARQIQKTLVNQKEIMRSFRQHFEWALDNIDAKHFAAEEETARFNGAICAL
jgi:hypothetical protein